jgi:hypothetical protein
MFGKTSLKDLPDVGIAFIAAVLFALGVSPILVIVLAAMLGIVLSNRSPPPIFVPQPQSESHSTKSLCDNLLIIHREPRETTAANGEIDPFSTTHDGKMENGDGFFERPPL